MADDYEPTSVPIRDGLLKMQDIRDWVEATEDAPEDAHAVVLPDEIQYSGMQP